MGFGGNRCHFYRLLSSYRLLPWDRSLSRKLSPAEKMRISFFASRKTEEELNTWLPSSTPGHVYLSGKDGCLIKHLTFFVLSADFFPHNQDHCFLFRCMQEKIRLLSLLFFPHNLLTNIIVSYFDACKKRKDSFIAIARVRTLGGNCRFRRGRSSRLENQICWGSNKHREGKHDGWRNICKPIQPIQ